MLKWKTKKAILYWLNKASKSGNVSISLLPIANLSSPLWEEFILLKKKIAYIFNFLGNGKFKDN